MGYYPAVNSLLQAKRETNDCILLTPDNMRFHGLVMSMTQGTSDISNIPEQVTIRLSLDSLSKKDQNIDLMLQIGQDAIISLVLDKEQTVQFTLSKPLIKASSLLIHEGQSGQAAFIFMAHINDFCKAY